jgi:hypothetical protein
LQQNLPKDFAVLHNLPEDCAQTSGRFCMEIFRGKLLFSFLNVDIENIYIQENKSNRGPCMESFRGKLLFSFLNVDIENIYIQEKKSHAGPFSFLQ